MEKQEKTPKIKTKLITIDYEDYEQLLYYENAFKEVISTFEVVSGKDPKDDFTTTKLIANKEAFVKAIGLEAPSKIEHISIEIK